MTNTTNLRNLVGVAASVLDPSEVTPDGVQRWAEGRGFSGVANLGDRAFARFVKDVRREQDARAQEAADLAAFR
jgi:hypothetical protein